MRTHGRNALCVSLLDALKKKVCPRKNDFLNTKTMVEGLPWWCSG